MPNAPQRKRTGVAIWSNYCEELAGSNIKPAIAREGWLKAVASRQQDASGQVGPFWVAAKYVVGQYTDGDTRLFEKLFSVPKPKLEELCEQIASPVDEIAEHLRAQLTASILAIRAALKYKDLVHAVREHQPKKVVQEAYHGLCDLLRKCIGAYGRFWYCGPLEELRRGSEFAIESVPARVRKKMLLPGLQDVYLNLNPEEGLPISMAFHAVRWLVFSKAPFRKVDSIWTLYVREVNGRKLALPAELELSQSRSSLPFTSHPHPVKMGFIGLDADFRNSFDRAVEMVGPDAVPAAWHLRFPSVGEATSIAASWNEPRAVHRFQRPPVLRGPSASAALAIGLATAGDESCPTHSVAVTASITAKGSLEPVESMPEKLAIAVWSQNFDTLVVSADDDVVKEAGDSLSVERLTDLDSAIQRLKPEADRAGKGRLIVGLALVALMSLGGAIAFNIWSSAAAIDPPDFDPSGSATTFGAIDLAQTDPPDWVPTSVWNASVTSLLNETVIDSIKNQFRDFNQKGMERYCFGGQALAAPAGRNYLVFPSSRTYIRVILLRDGQEISEADNVRLGQEPLLADYVAIDWPESGVMDIFLVMVPIKEESEYAPEVTQIAYGPNCQFQIHPLSRLKEMDQ